MNSKTLGSIGILAGTTIGAGLLALPLSSAGLGFLPTVALLVISYFLTALSALVILETLTTIPEHTDLHFDSMCRLTLGKWGEMCFFLAYMTLMYSITAAYLSGGSSIFYFLLEKAGIAPPSWACSILFTCSLAAIVCAGPRPTDIVNRYIMGAKAIVFFVILWLFMPQVSTANLLDMKDNAPFVFIAIPLIFLIFGYQLVLPSLFIYLNRNVTEMKKTIFIGSFISLAVFIIWLLLSFGSIPRFGAGSFFEFLSLHSASDIAPFFDMIGHTQSSERAKPLLNIFSNLALITSFLGITLSLKDYIKDIKWVRKGPSPIMTSNLLTFIPPLLLVLFIPALFQSALNYASGMLVIVLLWLPCAMAKKVRKKVKNEEWREAYRAPFGDGLLWLLSASGLLIFVLSMAATFELLPTFG